MACGVENHCKEACPPGAVLMQTIILCWAKVTHLAIRDLHEHVVTGVQGVRVGMRVWPTALRCSGGRWEGTQWRAKAEQLALAWHLDAQPCPSRLGNDAPGSTCHIRGKHIR